LEPQKLATSNQREFKTGFFELIATIANAKTSDKTTAR